MVRSTPPAYRVQDSSRNGSPACAQTTDRESTHVLVTGGEKEGSRMKLFNRNLVAVITAVLALAGAITTAQALEPTVVTFDNGVEGWQPGGDCGTIYPDGGHPGAYWNVASRICGTNDLILQGWFFLTNRSNPAFIGDYTAKGPVRLTVDIDVTDYTYYWFNSPVEEYRQLVVEFVDYDHPYTDPDTGYSWPYTSVIYPAGYLPNRDAGWKTFTIDIPDPSASEVPEGWIGFGGPEDPVTYMPQLPPGRTFADVMADVDEIQFHNIEPGYFYEYAFVYDVNFDNITIKELPQSCEGREATVWVDGDGIVRGGAHDGSPYAGELVGTDGDDVIIGTAGDDSIEGLEGNDLICGLAGNDLIISGMGDSMIFGGAGYDYLDGGAGYDVLNGGADIDSCVGGEVVSSCEARPFPGHPPVPPEVIIRSERSTSANTDVASSFGRNAPGQRTSSPGEATEPQSAKKIQGDRFIRE